MLSRYYSRADEEFFQFADRELIKINTFFAEKLAEAHRKYETLKNELQETNSFLKSNFKSDRQRKKSIEEDEEDEDENNLAKEADTKEESNVDSSRLGKTVALWP